MANVEQQVDETDEREQHKQSHVISGLSEAPLCKIMKMLRNL
jgi:hypothetical protein